MDLTYSADEASIRQAFSTLLDRHAGPQRARDVAAGERVDRNLLAQIDDAGFFDVLDDPTNLLMGSLLVEWASERGACAPVGYRLFLAPVLDLDLAPDTVVAVREADRPGPVRFAAEADVLVTLSHDAVHVHRKEEFSAVPEATIFGYPLATVTTSLQGRPVVNADPASVRRRKTIADVSELVGAAEAAFAVTVRYVKEREQFGRALGAFQAIQHRLADLKVTIEEVRWLLRYVAFHGATPADTALVALHAAEAARTTLTECQQLTGAIGLTWEFDLQIWSLRLPTLAAELGRRDFRADEVTDALWRGNVPTVAR